MKVSHFFEKKPDFAEKNSLIEIVGYKRFLIENHMGIINYSSSEIAIKVSYGRICVIGKDLSIMNISREQLVIIGHIESLQIIRRTV